MNTDNNSKFKKFLDEIIEFCEKYKQIGKYSVYIAAKRTLNLKKLTPEEYDSAIKKICETIGL